MKLSGMHAKQPTTATTLSRDADPNHDIKPNMMHMNARYKFFSHFTNAEFFPVNTPNIAMIVKVQLPSSVILIAGYTVSGNERIIAVM